MPKWSSSFVMLLLFSISVFIDIDAAEAQLFPRLRARIDQRMNQPRATVPQSQPGQSQPGQDPQLGNSQSMPNRQSSLRPATPLTGQDVSKQYSASIGVDVLPTRSPANGLRVEGFSDGSLAERAGLKKGDVIVAIDSEATPSVAAVAEILRPKRAGETVVVRVVRDRLAGNLTIPLIARTNFAKPEPRQRTGEPTLAAPLAESSTPPASDHPLAGIGIEVEDSPVARGVEVTRVPAESDARREGLRVGDRIVSLDGVIIHSKKSFYEQLTQRNLTQRNREPLAKLQVVRQNRLLSVPLPTEKQIAISGSAQKPSPQKELQQEPERSVLEPNLLGKGIGAAFGSLFGGSDTKQPEGKPDQQPKRPSDEFALEDGNGGNEAPDASGSIEQAGFEQAGFEQAGFEQIETPQPSLELPRDIPQPRAFE
ncbi:putative periplasmic serine endoprotease DegP-like precursor [Novipirellula aureliae]|uniref:Putative periplasmic serine endoprotease DegP-like n=1 Tax=Novipirellula aureliae TaxID=2527966 RepID=A0A5C6E5F9_9BACT|nr:PDZ domain-containing protein [Novipirellula aureliae]TWU43187.1 putative periplasmic serine endoprotease DegP-like precursor [Novipirellula aureliae]